MFLWDARDPLHRAKGETLKANIALRDYIALSSLAVDELLLLLDPAPSIRW